VSVRPDAPRECLARPVAGRRGVALCLLGSALQLVIARGVPRSDSSFARLMPAFSRIAYGVVRTSGLTAVWRRWRPGAVVLCYHNVVDGPVAVADPGLHLQRRAFEVQMEWLARRFDVVPLDELARRAESRASLRGLAAVTFDDAYQGTLQHGLPVLARLGLPCTVFVPSAYPDGGHGFWWDDAGAADLDDARRTRWLDELQGDATRIRSESGGASLSTSTACLPATWEALAAARSPLVSLGAHSVTHRNLCALDADALDRELCESAAAIAERTGERPRWFAYPYGRWNATVAHAARRAGYRGALTLDGADVEPGVDWMACPRINIPSSLSDSAFDAWVSGVAHLRARRAHMR